MRRAIPSLVAAGLSALAGQAAADQISSVRGAELRIERAQVSARRVGSMVHATVRYELVNPGPTADAAEVDLDPPVGTTITGVRYRMGDRWLAGTLQNAEAAAERFAEYIDTPFVAARGALLVTDDGGHRQLELSYLAPRGRVPVILELALPACFARDRWIAPVPLHDPVPRLHAAGGRVEAADVLEKHLGSSLEDACAGYDAFTAGEDRYLVWDDRPAPGGEATLTTVTAGSVIVSELAIETATELVPAPRGAAVVFAIDASRSLGDLGIATQVAVIRGYLAHLPDARVEMIAVRRHATRLFGDFVPAGDALDRLANLPPGALAPGNGSHLDAGLTAAADALATTRGPHRLIAFTDDRTRTSLDGRLVAAALAGAPADTIVHLALPIPGAETLVSRDFEHRFAPVIEHWGGIVADVGVQTDLAPLAELVRPSRIEAITVEGLGDGVESPGELVEGTGLRVLYVGDRAPIVRGWIWGRRWQPTAVHTRAATARVARVTIGTLAGGLDDATVVTLAALGGVASRATSFLAEDPSWRPGGLPADELGITRGYSSSCGPSSHLSAVGHFGTIGHGSGTGTGRVEPEPELAPLLAARVAACAAAVPAPWTTTVDVETTGVEVVDVAVTSTGAAASRARFDACVTEAAWDLQLDERFERYTRTFTASFDG